MNYFQYHFIGFYTNDVHYTDTDNLYTENKHRQKLDEVGIVVKNRLQSINDDKEGVIWYGVFLAPKIKHCLTINKFGFTDEHKTFKSFSNVSVNSNRKEYFKIAIRGKLIAKVFLSWKKIIQSRRCNSTYSKKLW